MKIFVTLGDIIGIVVLILFIILSIVYFIVQEIKKIGKKNCYECKYYKLDNVASCGDCCWYRCTKYNRKDDGTSMNTREHYEKCNCFDVKDSD